MIKITTTGIPDVLGKLGGLSTLLDNQEFLDIALGIHLENTQRRFLQKVDPDGNPWVPSQAGLDRAYKGFPFGTLFDTGLLYSSLSAEALDAHTGVVFQDTDIAPYGDELFDMWYFLGPSQEDMVKTQAAVLARMLKEW